MAGLNQGTVNTIVIYKSQLQELAKRSKIPGNNIPKRNITYTSLSNRETELVEDDDGHKEDDMRSFTSRHSKRSLFSRTHRTISKISNLSNLSVASRSSKSRSKRRKEKSRSHRSERKSEDNKSKSSKSFSVKTFYRNRRSRNRNQSQNPSYHGLISRPMSTTHSKRSKTRSSRMDTSGHWRCEQCHYFPNTSFDPHCYKCGAMNHKVVKPRNKSRKCTVSNTGTVSSSPILAPGSNQLHSSNIPHSHIIVHSSGDNTSDQMTTDDDDDAFSSTHSSYSTSDSSTDDCTSNDQAIIVEEYRSKTSQSNSRLAIGQHMDIDDNMDIALPAKHTKTGMDHEPDEYEDDHKSDSDTSINNGEMGTLHVAKRRRFSDSFASSISHVMDIFYWNKSKLSSVPRKTQEWNAFQWYLGLKRFILALLYFSLALEEAFVLKHVSGWMSLPLALCVTYVLLIIYIGRFNVIKYDSWRRSVVLVVFYIMNVLILVAPPMSALIASAKVYDFRDILDRDMLCNHLMWICFAISVVSMVFIDVVIVHHNEDILDKYRVETFKLAVVKDEEYVLNNQCLWYKVPMKDWGKIHDTLKKKRKKEKRLDDGHLYHCPQNTDTKSYFVQIDQEVDTNIEEAEDDNKDDDDDDEEESTNFEDEDVENEDSSEAEENVVDVNVDNIGNINMENRNAMNIDNELDDDRQSTHSITNIINKNRDTNIRRCCSKPFSVLQWILVIVFFISLQLCVIFAVCDTNIIEEHDVSGPPVN